MSEISPKVSIVCAWYNRSKYIVESIESVLNQDYDNLEIIIVNDGSTDDDVAGILDKFVSDKVIVIHQENKGFTEAIRNAISESTGEFIAVHGAGDISLPKRISKLVECITSDVSLVAVGSGTAQYPADYPLRKRHFTPRVSCTANDLKTNMPFVHGTVMYRKSSYEFAGGYDSRFKYCSDWDFFFRLVELGTVTAVSETLYEQRIFSDGFSFSPKHKFRQVWFKDRAVDRTSSSRKMLDNANEYLSDINPEDKKYLSYSLRFLIKSVYKLDLRNSLEWFKLVIIQTKNKLLS